MGTFIYSENSDELLHDQDLQYLLSSIGSSDKHTTFPNHDNLTRLIYTMDSPKFI